MEKVTQNKPSNNQAEMPDFYSKQTLLIKEFAIKTFLLIAGVACTVGMLYLFSEVNVLRVLPFLSRLQLTGVTILLNGISFTICRNVILKAAQSFIEKILNKKINEEEKQKQLYNVSLISKDFVLACDIATIARVVKVILSTQNPGLMIAGYFLTLETAMHVVAVISLLQLHTTGKHYLVRPDRLENEDRALVEDITSSIYPRLNSNQQASFQSLVMHKSINPELDFGILREMQKKSLQKEEIQKIREEYEQKLQKKDQEIQELKKQNDALKSAEPLQKLKQKKTALDEAILWNEHYQKQISELQEQVTQLRKALSEKPKADPKEIEALKKQVKQEEDLSKHFKDKWYENELQINRLRGKISRLEKKIKEGFVVVD
ncbi:MAG: hypothetical protein JSR58_03195 [Verrucomicrobia bacterium]|nr:hypothetical protein [Verrucomicrobiota bacterium]